MAETIEAFGARLGRLLAKQGCKNVALSWSSDGKFQVTCYLRFLGRDGLEQATSFDWPPARGAVDDLMSKVVGYPVTVDREGEEVHAVPAVPNVDPPKFGYPTMGGYIAQCETCDGISVPVTRERRLVPWRSGVCTACGGIETPLSALVDSLQGQSGEANGDVARMNEALTEANQEIVRLRAQVTDLTGKLSGLYNRAAGAELRYSNGHPRTALNEVMAPQAPAPYVCPVDDYDLLPDVPPRR